jgi:hypothetical protein
MVGTKDTHGFCRKSCGLCDAWTAQPIWMCFGVLSHSLWFWPHHVFHSAEL